MLIDIKEIKDDEIRRIYIPEVNAVGIYIPEKYLYLIQLTMLSMGYHKFHYYSTVSEGTLIKKIIPYNKESSRYYLITKKDIFTGEKKEYITKTDVLTYRYSWGGMRMIISIINNVRDKKPLSAFRIIPSRRRKLLKGARYE